MPLRDDPIAPTATFGARVHAAKIVERRMSLMEEHALRCASEIARREFDVLLVHPCQQFHASPLALFSDLPSILYLQEPFRELYEARSELPWSSPWREFEHTSPSFWKRFVGDATRLANKRVQVREERRWVAAFDQILVNSFFSRESVIRAYNLDARVCYLGVDLAEFVPTALPKERYIIGLGSIGFNKRPQFAVECIAAIPEAKRPRLVWVGNSGNADELKRMAHARGVELDVRMLISQDELRSLLGRAAAMIYTSHLEPFGYAPLEANACGTGVVAIAEGGVRETVGHADSGILIPNLDATSFAEALLPFCEDLDFARQFGLRSRRYVERSWSGERAATMLESELHRVVSRSAARAATS